MSNTFSVVNRSIQVDAAGHVAINGCKVPDHIALREGWLRSAPADVVRKVAERSRGEGPNGVAYPWWGYLLKVAAAGSVTAAAGITMDAIRTGGGSVVFSVETTPSAAGEENLLTAQYSADNSAWSAASGTTASLTIQAMTAIAASGMTIPAGPAWVRLKVSSTQNAAVTSAYNVKYRIIF